MSVEKTADRTAWHSPLCGCLDDMASCLISWRFPAAQFGLNKQRMDGSSCGESCCAYFLLHICCQCWIVHAPFRRALRDRFGLEAAPCNDCLVVSFCPCCSLAQEARELNFQSAPGRESMDNGGQMISGQVS